MLKINITQTEDYFTDDLTIKATTTIEGHTFTEQLSTFYSVSDSEVERLKTAVIRRIKKQITDSFQIEET